MSDCRTEWNRVPRPIQIVIYTILGICGAVALGFLFGIAIKLLWNWLMPELFGLGEISYWQAIGVFILARFIFGCGFGGDNDHTSKKDRKCRDKESDADAGWTEYEEWWQTEGKKAFEQYAAGKGEAQNGEPA